MIIPLAKCSRSKHVLAKYDDETSVIDYRAAVAGLAARRGRPGNEHQEAPAWSRLSSSEAGQATALSMCPCNQEFWLDFDALMAARLQGVTPMILEALSESRQTRP